MNEGLRDDFDDISCEQLISFLSELNSRLEKDESEKLRFMESSYDGFWNWDLEKNHEYLSPRF